MTKFFLGIAIIAFTTFCGYVLSKKYRKRKLFFTQLHHFNERFLGELSYYRRPVGDFISKHAYKGDFNDFLSYYFENIENPSFFEENIDKTNFSFFTKDEKRFLCDYFPMLGKGNSATQKAYFSTAKSQLETLKKTAETDAKKYGDLYVKLGFLCGLLILILII